MARPKVLITRRWPEAVERLLGDRYETTLNAADAPMGPEAMAKALRGFDAVCPTVSDTLDAAVLEQGAGGVKILGNYGVGVNHIDLEARRATISISRMASSAVASVRTSGVLVTTIPSRRQASRSMWFTPTP